jgi:hypothetical protein
MSIAELLQLLDGAPLVTCAPRIENRRTRLKFAVEPPEDPGVYVIYQRDPARPFYVGETRDLRQRLRFLFRCRPSQNPHPCHARYLEVFGVMPECDDFCGQYGSRRISSKGLFGRLEMEELLQQRFGTNLQAFYLNYLSRPTKV